MFSNGWSSPIVLAPCRCAAFIKFNSCVNLELSFVSVVAFVNTETSSFACPLSLSTYIPALRTKVNVFFPVAVALALMVIFVLLFILVTVVEAGIPVPLIPIPTNIFSVEVIATTLSLDIVEPLKETTPTSLSKYILVCVEGKVNCVVVSVALLVALALIVRLVSPNEDIVVPLGIPE